MMQASGAWSTCGRIPAVDTILNSVGTRWNSGCPTRGSTTRGYARWEDDASRYPDSQHVALRNDAFRAYADYMETDAFRDAVAELVALATTERATVMCSESVWWRCHRRLIADHLVLVRGVDVVHLMHDGRATLHVPTEGVRLAGNSLVYDVGATLSLSPVVAESARADAISDLGGDSACWAHLVCPECGALSDEGHRPGCASAETR